MWSAFHSLARRAQESSNCYSVETYGVIFHLKETKLPTQLMQQVTDNDFERRL